MDAYKILGIEPTATESEIKSAFRRQAKKYHPDTGGDSWVFQQVQDAYSELMGQKDKSEAPAESTPAATDPQAKPKRQNSADSKSAESSAHVFDSFYSSGPTQRGTRRQTYEAKKKRPKKIASAPFPMVQTLWSLGAGVALLVALILFAVYYDSTPGPGPPDPPGKRGDTDPEPQPDPSPKPKPDPEPKPDPNPLEPDSETLITLPKLSQPVKAGSKLNYDLRGPNLEGVSVKYYLAPEFLKLSNGATLSKDGLFTWTVPSVQRNEHFVFQIEAYSGGEKFLKSFRIEVAGADGEPRSPEPDDTFIKVPREFDNITYWKWEGSKRFVGDHFEEAIKVYEVLGKRKEKENKLLANQQLARCYSMLGKTDEAIECLKLAVDYGWKNKEEIESDDSLMNINDSDEFKEILSSLR